MVYSIDFRSSVLRYYQIYHVQTKSGTVIRDITHIFNIPSSTLYNWINLFKKTGSLNHHNIGRPTNSCKINEDMQKYIIKYFTLDHKNNIKNLLRSIKRIFNVAIKRSSVYYVLHKNNISYKKTSISHDPYTNKELEKKKVILRNSLDISDKG